MTLCNIKEFSLVCILVKYGSLLYTSEVHRAKISSAENNFGRKLSFLSLVQLQSSIYKCIIFQKVMYISSVSNALLLLNTLSAYTDNLCLLLLVSEIPCLSFLNNR